MEDLRHVRDYVSTAWGDAAATKILKKISSDIRNLEQYPSSGVALGKTIDVSTEYRYLFSEKNYIFYRLEADNIRIIRVLNERQDYLRQLFGINPEISED